MVIFDLEDEMLIWPENEPMSAWYSEHGMLYGWGNPFNLVADTPALVWNSLLDCLAEVADILGENEKSIEVDLPASLSLLGFTLEPAAPLVLDGDGFHFNASLWTSLLSELDLLISGRTDPCRVGFTLSSHVTVPLPVWPHEIEVSASASFEFGYDAKKDKYYAETPIELALGTVIVRIYQDGEIVPQVSWDVDVDGLKNAVESLIGTLMGDDDTDNDGSLDGNPKGDECEDLNNNGVVDPGETDPRNPDSDGDGIFDGTEIGLTEPEGHDTDLSAGFFIADKDPTTTTDPADPDTDDDGLLDGQEDADHDGAVDTGETNPGDADSDDDGYGDGEEVARGSNPLDDESAPVVGDCDADGDVDQDDLNLVLVARNQPASGPYDPRDLDGDGMITALDARKLVLIIQSQQ